MKENLKRKIRLKLPKSLRESLAHSNMKLFQHLEVLPGYLEFRLYLQRAMQLDFDAAALDPKLQTYLYHYVGPVLKLKQ